MCSRIDKKNSTEKLSYSTRGFLHVGVNLSIDTDLNWRKQ